MDHTQADIDSLAEKLAVANLTDGEQAVLDALVDAAEGEVAGFGIGLDFGLLRGVSGSATPNSGITTQVSGSAEPNTGLTADPSRVAGSAAPNSG